MVNAIQRTQNATAATATVAQDKITLLRVVRHVDVVMFFCLIQLVKHRVAINLLAEVVTDEVVRGKIKIHADIHRIVADLLTSKMFFFATIAGTYGKPPGASDHVSCILVLKDVLFR